jgi:hypothetical protein
MLSTKLVQLIQSHSDEITRRVLIAMRSHPDLPQLSKRPEAELRDWCGDILRNLGDLLSAGKNEEVQRRFQILGKIRFEENIPLPEAVLRFHLLKDKIIGFIHEQGFAMTAIQLYAEEELEQRMGRFFDACVYHVVCGYEQARHRAKRLAS